MLNDLSDYDYIDLLFEDLDSGEEFFVELEVNGNTEEELIAQAEIIVNEYFDNAKYLHLVDPVTAEEWGLDTY